jgi:hypothetical protein
MLLPFFLCMKTKCETKYCKNKVKGKYCSTCRSKKSREQNPVKYSYSNLKSNSKRRGIAFKLTFEEFIQFCYQTQYLAGKGKTKTSFSIDRIENDKGYTLDNIRILTLSDNSKKGNKKILMYDWQTKYASVISNNVDIQPSTENYF